MSGSGGLGCGVLSDLDGMITGVVPVRRSEVAHELHVKWAWESPVKSGMPITLKPSQCNTRKFPTIFFNMTDMSR